VAAHRGDNAVTKIRDLNAPDEAAVGSPVPTGTVLGGKYRVGTILGVGGVGVVVAAEHLELGEPVAIKFLREEASRDATVVARFWREAKAAVSIRSEHVARVLDVAKTPEGLPYFVMEYLEGQDLGALVMARGQLPVGEAVEYVMQAGEALAMAHARGIVHRDVKPENIFLARQSQGLSVIKVLDFGISKASLTGSMMGGAIPLVDTQNLMGTPLYMAPEQVRSTDAVDPRTDIWALGMVLYELLTGTTAFMASTVTELAAQILEAPPTPLHEFRGDVPESLAQIVMRCLEKRPEDRYQNVAELLAALLPFAPKRSRANVERASVALTAAGLMEHAIEVHSHAPPAFDGAPHVIRITPQDAPTIGPPATVATEGPVVPVAPRSRLGFAIAGSLIGLGIAIAIAWSIQAESGRDGARDVRSSASAPDPEAHPLATATTPEPMAVASPSAPPADTTSAAPMLVPPTRRLPPPRLGASTSPAASVTVAPNSTQKSDEPDLGY
jgi:serine/threonine-protein kinase